MIEAAGVSFGYGSTDILAGVDLSTNPGEVLGLIGPNGSGKSTLLRCLHRALKPSSGAVMIGDEPVERLTTREVARRIAVVPQDARSNLAMTVAELVLLGRSPHTSEHRAFSTVDREIATDALDRVGALALAHRSVNTLSGGERQRVAIARCLAQQTPIVLLDEPTNHLDIRYQHEILELLRSIELTTVVVLHDLNLAARYCDRLALLHHQRIVTIGPVDDVLQPAILEPIYGITIRAIRDGHHPHLLFGPPPTRHP